MSGRDSDESGKKPISPELSAKFKRALDKLRPTLPIEEGKFTPDLKQVGLYYLQEGAEREGEGEFARFVSGDPSQFLTYGMTEEEKRKATLRYDADQDCLVDSEGKKATSGKFLYNVTKEGDLVIVPDSREDSHHSSITRDGAIICAGYLEIDEGKINYINTNSGHYRPEDLDLYNAAKILQKQSPKIFAEKAKVESHESGTKSLSEFIIFMEEPISHESSAILRVDDLREKRRLEHAKISLTSEKIIFKESESLEASICSTNLSHAIKEGKQYLFNFPKELFEPEYVSEYAKKTFGIENQEDKLSSVTLTSIELLEYLSKNHEKNANSIKHLIDSGISLDKNFQKGANNIAEDEIIFDHLTKYHIKNPCDYSTRMLGELTYATEDKDKIRVIADHLLKPENFEKTSSLIPSEYAQARLISKASVDTQSQIIDKLILNKENARSQEVLITLSENKNITSEKRADIIREVCIKPKLTKLLQNASDAGSITEKDRAEFDAIKKDAIRLGEVLGDKEKAVFTKHIGGIIREIALEKGIKLNMRVKTIQILSDRAHILGYKRQERDLVKTMIGLSNSETSKPLPSPVNKGSRGRRVF